MPPTPTLCLYRLVRHRFGVVRGLLTAAHPRGGRGVNKKTIATERKALTQDAERYLRILVYLRVRLRRGTIDHTTRTEDRPCPPTNSTPA